MAKSVIDMQAVSQALKELDMELHGNWEFRVAVVSISNWELMGSPSMSHVFDIVKTSYLHTCQTLESEGAVALRLALGPDGTALWADPASDYFNIRVCCLYPTREVADPRQQLAVHDYMNELSKQSSDLRGRTIQAPMPSGARFVDYGQRV